MTKTTRHTMTRYYADGAHRGELEITASRPAEAAEEYASAISWKTDPDADHTKPLAVRVADANAVDAVRTGETDDEAHLWTTVEVSS